MATSTEPHSKQVADVLRGADELVGAGRTLEALESLKTAAASFPHPDIEARLAEVRHQSFPELPRGGFDSWPPTADTTHRGGPPCIPESEPSQLTGDLVRENILGHGSLLVRGLFESHVEQFVDGIESALAAQDALKRDGDGDRAWVRPLRLPREQAKSLGRYWVSAAGGLLACDSPRLLRMLFDSYTDLGLRDVVQSYLGEAPVLSANKCTMRRVPLSASADWHQDGAFLGDGIRALNIWIALSDCGVDSPGMDLVPKRLDGVVETGTGGAIFDWAVGPDVVRSIAADAPVVRPQFRAGDVLFFDDLFLHRTAIDDTMTRPRYAIESWFFAPTNYPDGQVPLVW